MSCLIVGCGYVGSEFAARAVRNDCEVYAVTRTEEKGESLRQQGIVPILYDWLSDEPCPLLPDVENLLIAVSHASAESIPPAETHVRGLSNLFARGTDWFHRVIYLSTTGVFASAGDGEWIDETSLTHPKRPGSIAALEAEKWLANRLDPARRVCLRLAGIYGPDRVPNVQKLIQQQPIEADPDSYLNLIHVADIGAIIWKCMEQRPISEMYCVSDGSPTLRREYYSEICKWLDLPLPTFQKQQPSIEPNSSLASVPKRGSDNKRISNSKLVHELAYEFLFPSFREGLAPLLRR